MMKSIGAMVLALGLVLSFGSAYADEIAGKIQSVNSGERMVTLEDGTQLWVAEGVSIDGVKEGASVKASYEERDGKKIATGLEITD